MLTVGFLPLEDPPLDRLLVANGVTMLGAAGIAVLATLIAAEALGTKVRFGIGMRSLLKGVTTTVVATPVVLAIMLAAGLALTLVRTAMGLEPSATHELLIELQAASGGTVVLIIFTALVVAPVAEEVLFRGVMQTGLAQGLAVVFQGSTPSAEPVLADAGRAVRRNVGPLARWVAIVVTAGAFALVHEPWSMPLIFLLAVGLGWLYERTQSLWAVIGVHFAFNAFNTGLALLVA
jgi:membrane protease YdiL (CAAX protease family)